MTGIDPITLAEAGPVMARAYGLDWEQDRNEVVRHVNRYRELLFSLYNTFKLFDSSYHCIEVSKYRINCQSDGTYNGIALPPDIVSVEDAWENSEPMKIRSHWREGHSGVGLTTARKLDLIEVGQAFPTERDILCPAGIKIFAGGDDDGGKIVLVEGRDPDGKPLKAHIELIANGWSVTRRKRFAQIDRVALPPKRCGEVRIATADGHLLSVYAPWETVPSYRRFRVGHRCEASTIVIKGAKKFIPIFFDSDIVEVGNSLIIEAAGNYFKYDDSTTDANELKRADRDFGKMKSLLDGAISRHSGGAVQDGNPFRYRGKKQTKTLPGYRR
jgi:hypothetical protein